MKIFDKLFGTHSERELKLIHPVIDRIEELRPAMQALGDEELQMPNPTPAFQTVIFMQFL